MFDQIVWSVDQWGTGSVSEASAVDEDHDGEGVVASREGGVDVEDEAVLAAKDLGAREPLRASDVLVIRVVDTLPGQCWFCSLERKLYIKEICTYLQRKSI